MGERMQRLQQSWAPELPLRHLVPAQRQRVRERLGEKMPQPQHTTAPMMIPPQGSSAAKE
jgi:hypothetical protein